MQLNNKKHSVSKYERWINKQVRPSIGINLRNANKNIDPETLKSNIIRYHFKKASNKLGFLANGMCRCMPTETKIIL